MLIYNFSVALVLDDDWTDWLFYNNYPNRPSMAQYLSIAFKGMLLPSRTALHVTPWQICSFRHQLGFSEKHSAMLQLLRKEPELGGASQQND